jgi:hypothetical protein
METSPGEDILEITTMQDSQSKPSRRGFFFGAAAAGAVAATAVALPGVVSESQDVLPDARPVPEKGGGYNLSEHVKRYYKTTRL